MSHRLLTPIALKRKPAAEFPSYRQDPCLPPKVPGGPARFIQPTEQFSFVPLDPPPSRALDYGQSVCCTQRPAFVLLMAIAQLPPNEMCFMCSMTQKLCFPCLVEGVPQPVGPNAPCEACKALGRQCYPLAGKPATVCWREHPNDEDGNPGTTLMHGDGIPGDDAVPNGAHLHPFVGFPVAYRPPMTLHELAEMYIQIIVHCMTRIASLEQKGARLRIVELIVFGLFRRVALLEGDVAPGAGDEYVQSKPLQETTLEDLNYFLQLLNESPPRSLKSIFAAFEQYRAGGAAPAAEATPPPEPVASGSGHRSSSQDTPRRQPQPRRATSSASDDTRVESEVIMEASAESPASNDASHRPRDAQA